MEAGIKNEKSIVVTDEVTASKVGSGLLPVYATPSMNRIDGRHMCRKRSAYLAEGEGTVGVAVDIKHIAANTSGHDLSDGESLLKEVNGKGSLYLK